MPIAVFCARHSSEVMSVDVLYIGLTVLALYGLYRKLSGLTLKDIRGPKPESFITGTLIRTLYQWRVRLNVGR